ncbi:MAG: homoserine O-acetyltransferase, partial [Acidimicrobiia bacterium]|nr:homoserine O-acetyltransferase [Acidimicrobiia bacterium]
RGRASIAAALGSITARALVIGITSDVLFPVVEQRELAAGIPDSDFEILEGEHGHDSFLIDTEKVSAMIATFLDSI